MKKEIFAAFLLLSLIIGSLFNIFYVKEFISDVEQELLLSQISFYNGDIESSETYLRSALDIWNSAGLYTDIFIRHNETDTTTDYFYDVLSALYSDNPKSVLGAYEKLFSRLTEIYTIEQISFGSVF